MLTFIVVSIFIIGIIIILGILKKKKEIDEKDSDGTIHPK
jgi:preprotein translocase subunit SecG